MSDEQKELRPTGKRQLEGSSTPQGDGLNPAPASKPKEENTSPGGGVLAFPGEVVAEMRKVVWPTGREMVNYTVIVFAFLIFMTALTWGVDQLATLGVEAILIP